MAYCSECGNELQNGLKFCPFCGAKQISLISDEELTKQNVEIDENPLPKQEESQKSDEVIYIGQAFDKEESNADSIDAVVSQEVDAAKDEPVKFEDTAEQADTAVLIESEQTVEVTQVDSEENMEIGVVEATPYTENTAEVQSADAADEIAQQPVIEDKSAEECEPPIQPLEPIISEADSSPASAPMYQTTAPNPVIAAPNNAQVKQPFTFFCVQDNSESFDKADISENKVLSAFSYFPPLFFLPLVLKKESKFARFHANQSLLLTITAAVWSLLNVILSVIIKANFHTATYWGYRQLNTAGVILTTLVWSLEIIGTVTLFYLGLIDTMNGRAKKLPIIGRFNFLFK